MFRDAPGVCHLKYCKNMLKNILFGAIGVTSAVFSIFRVIFRAHTSQDDDWAGGKRCSGQRCRAAGTGPIAPSAGVTVGPTHAGVGAGDAAQLQGDFYIFEGKSSARGRGNEGSAPASRRVPAA